MGRTVVSLATLVLLGVTGVEPKVRACGTDLANTVSLVCDGLFAGPPRPPLKRAMSSDTEDEDVEPHWQSVEFGDPDPVMDLFLDRAQALRLLQSLPGLQRVRRSGLANECCRKACTIHEISSYCRTNPQFSTAMQM